MLSPKDRIHHRQQVAQRYRAWPSSSLEGASRSFGLNALHFTVRERRILRDNERMARRELNRRVALALATGGR